MVSRRILLMRAKSGNLLVFSTAVTIAIVAVLAFFSLSYIRLLGSNSEQRNAIEAAALAAARDLSMIAINTDDYGWISLSDAAPTGSLTTAGDSYNVPVRGINTILGTLRLDLIIANQLGDANLKTMIKADIVKAKAAQALLATELSKSLVAGYGAKDINGSTVNVYADAENAYKSNQIRMTGSSNYINNSLKLSLGGIINGAMTNTPLPNPKAMADVPAAKQQNDFYISYLDIPTDGESFVFAGIGDSMKLVDPRQWVAVVPGLPYQVATIVKAEADQHVTDTQNPSGYDIHAVACAQPANVADPKPAPGALTFSFPDGIPPEMVNPGSMLSNVQLNTGMNTTYQSSKGGDYPNGRPITHMEDITWPYPSLDQSSGNVFRRALIDWWKRAGTKLNVASAEAMINDPTYKFVAPSPINVDWKTQAVKNKPTIFNFGPIPKGNIHIYRIDPSATGANIGKISYQQMNLTPINYSVAGENQMYSENIDALNSTAAPVTVGPFEVNIPGLPVKPVKLLSKFDVYVRDQVFSPGSIAGGQHAGEPMDFAKVSHLQLKHDLGGGGLGGIPVVQPKSMGLPPSITSQSDFAESSGFSSTKYNSYSTGPGTKNMRPTYQKNGMAVDIRFRRQVDTGFLSGALGFKIGYIGQKFGASTVAIPAVPIISGISDPDDDEAGPPENPTQNDNDGDNDSDADGDDRE